MDWMKLIDASVLGGWVRAAVAVLMTSALAKWPVLSGLVTPEFQELTAALIACVVVGVWSQAVKR